MENSAELLRQFDRLLQAVDIMKKGYEEVEVDGDMVDPYDLIREARQVLEASR